LSFSLAGLTITRILLGGLLQKISSFTVLITSFLLTTAGSCILLYSDSYDLSFASLIIIGVGLAAGFPVVLGYVAQLYVTLSGTAFSIALVIALSGNILINYLFGLIADNYSIRNLPLLIIACVFCMFILAVLLKQKISLRVKL
ncbi:MAG: MFS transporter, partial [Chitinophagales bacterium]